MPKKIMKSFGLSSEDAQIWNMLWMKNKGKLANPVTQVYFESDC